MRITVDFETRSRLSLPRVTSRLYAHHPSTEVMCIALLGEDGRPVYWAPKKFMTEWLYSSPDFVSVAQLNELIRSADEVEAYNAEFEIDMWDRAVADHAFQEVPLEKWRCSMSLCSHVALPQALDKACAALGIEGKDTQGHKVMMRMCKPGRKGEFIWTPELMDALVRYCVQDVRAERALSDALPPLSGNELEVWRDTVRVNRRGIPVDIEGCRVMEAVVKSAIKDAAEALDI